MNRSHVELMLEGANKILPDEYLPNLDLEEEDWGSAISVGKLLLDIGLELVKDFESGRVILSRGQKWLVALLNEGSLGRRERVEAGNILAKLGDIRFNKEKWYLPAEPLFGFVEIPAGPFVMGELEEQHTTSIPTFYMARYPVTVGQFRIFVEESNFCLECPESIKGLDNHPLVLVDWNEALVYANWLGKKLVDISKSKLDKKKN